MRLAGKSFSLSLASFPPWNLESDFRDPPEDMQGAGLSDRLQGHDTSSDVQESAAKLVAATVSGAEAMTGCQMDPFVPNSYTAQLDWHQGPRAALSRLFPRYGRYCGPNYSSGRDGGSKTWDSAPVDWLDNCCYRHDMAYDSHDQAVLLEADIQLLRCLRNRPRKPNGKKVELVYPWGEAYELAAKHGLQHFLIPYRAALVRMNKKRRKAENPQLMERNEDTDRRPSLDI